MNEPWVTLDDITRHLSASRNSIYRWIDDQGIPAHKVGGVWQFKVPAVGSRRRGAGPG